MPLGPADDAAICLGVEQVPLFIVAGKNGRKFTGREPGGKLRRLSRRKWNDMLTKVLQCRDIAGSMLFP